MSAVELREAARLMRERAEAARAGRWHSIGSDVRATWSDGPRFVAECTGSLRAGNEDNAEHIASWDPTVALAVADLLDDLADIDTIRRPELVADSALAVARAYLAT